jgi:hypothetical protein
MTPPLTPAHHALIRLLAEQAAQCWLREQQLAASKPALTKNMPEPSPARIQLSRTKGWRMPENTVKVDRTTRWGNPFKLHGDGQSMAPEVAVGLFRRLLQEQGGFIAQVRGQAIQTTVADIRRELRGKNLACWCPLSGPCHADVLLQLANDETGGGDATPLTNTSPKVAP